MAFVRALSPPPEPRPGLRAPPRSRAAPHRLVPGPGRRRPVFIPPPRTVLFSTVRKPWADVIPCGYEMQHTLRDLVPLKAFLLAGTTVTIVEEKVEFSVVDTLPPKARPSSSPCSLASTACAPFQKDPSQPRLSPRSLEAALLSPRFSPGLWWHLRSTVPCLPRKEKGKRTRKRRKARRERTGKTRQRKPSRRQARYGRPRGAAVGPGMAGAARHPPGLSLQEQTGPAATCTAGGSAWRGGGWGWSLLRA